MIVTDPRARTLLYRMMIPLRFNASPTSFRDLVVPRSRANFRPRGSRRGEALRMLPLLDVNDDPCFIIDQEFGYSDSRSDQLIDR